MNRQSHTHTIPELASTNADTHTSKAKISEIIDNFVTHTEKNDIRNDSDEFNTSRNEEHIHCSSSIPDLEDID